MCGKVKKIEAEMLRVLRQHRREHAGNNVATLALHLVADASALENKVSTGQARFVPHWNNLTDFLRLSSAGQLAPLEPPSPFGQ